MKKITAQTGRHFTLVELMIAMAVLVIMMGFLFQFMISAQRLWSASNNNDILFEQAQLCFDLLEKDLKAAIVQDEETNPGRAIPYFANTTALDGNTASSKLLLFVVTQAGGEQDTLNSMNGSVAFPVVYYTGYEGAPEDPTKPKHNLYRRVIDTVIDSKNPLYCYGISATVFSSYPAYLETKEALFLPRTSEYLLCDNIASIKLDRHSSKAIDNYHLPEVVKITLELTDLAVKDSNEAKTRVFSKTIFLRQFCSPL